jgi:hypothetical protein
VAGLRRGEQLAVTGRDLTKDALRNVEVHERRLRERVEALRIAQDRANGGRPRGTRLQVFGDGGRQLCAV